MATLNNVLCRRDLSNIPAALFFVLRAFLRRGTACGRSNFIIDMVISSPPESLSFFCDRLVGSENNISPSRDSKTGDLSAVGAFPDLGELIKFTLGEVIGGSKDTPAKSNNQHSIKHNMSGITN